MVNATPDPPPAPSIKPYEDSEDAGATGSSTYPTKPTAAPPVPPPPGAGLEVAFQRYIVVDQFGYRPDMQKVAVLVDPVEGWNAGESYQPGPSLEVRKWSDSSVVSQGKPVLWNDGKVDEESGDRGWWFDFSAVKEPGRYYVYDAKNRGRSHPFEVNAKVYRSPLVAAVKAFYFNRANVAKKAPYACVGKRCWTQGADHVGPGQDTEARSVVDRDNPKTARDLSGGWWDAGDTNKYVTFAHEPVHLLLAAYRENPAPFGDDFGIPESGNGVPDVLDELKVELDWLQRMQPADLKGGVLIKVGSVEQNEPLPDQSKAPRFYYPKACSSATIALASMFAHAALVFEKVSGQAEYAAGLKKRSIKAFDFYHANPKSDACDDGTIKSGDADKPQQVQDQYAVVAAIYLYLLTGDAKYGDYVREHFKRLRPYQDDRWSVYEPSQGDALLAYATSPKADGAVKQDVLNKKRSEASKLDFYKDTMNDLYRSYMRRDSYHWGSNMVRAGYGNTNMDMVEFGLANGAEREAFLERAAGMLHSFHGVNPLQVVYLTNMYGLGGDECVDEVFHTWFRDGHPLWDNARTSRLGPAPGYVPGGPNTQYCSGQGPDHACSTSPVKSQPPGKAYLDSNKSWEPTSPFDKTWELSEPAIYYQAAYVKLVSKFVQ